MTFKRWICLALIALGGANANAVTNRTLNATQIQNGSGLWKIPSSTPTASRACVFDASSVPGSSSVTSTELDFLSGLSGKVPESKGGTNQTTYATGDMLYASASNTISKLTAGATNTLMRIVGGVPVWDTFYNPRRQLCLYDEFYTYTGTARLLVPAASGDATSASSDATASVPDGTHVSVLKHTLSAATGYLVLATPSADSNAMMVFSGGATTIEASFWLSALSDGTDTQTLRIGGGDAYSQSEPTDGCWLLYTHGNNSGQWTTKCCNNGSCTAQDSSIAVSATTWYVARLEVNSAGTSVQGMISASGGAFQNVGAAVTTNIPVAYPRIFNAPYLQFTKTVGTNARYVIWDYAWMCKDVTR